MTSLVYGQVYFPINYSGMILGTMELPSPSCSVSVLECPTTRHSRKLNVTGGKATRHAWSILCGIA